ncbi:MAG: colicin import membrane protein [Candidatus Paceibacteria bacterium]|jgi:colicin import membrane protein
MRAKQNQTRVAKPNGMWMNLGLGLLVFAGLGPLVTASAHVQPNVSLASQASRAQGGTRAKSQSGGAPQNGQRSKSAGKQNADTGQASGSKRVKQARQGQRDKRAGDKQEKRVKQARDQDKQAKQVRFNSARKQAEGAGVGEQPSRAESAREQKARADAAAVQRAERAKAARAQSHATDAQQDAASARGAAARAQAEANRIGQAREQASQTAENSERIGNARDQRAQRIGSARRQMTAAEKNARIANARGVLASLQASQHSATKRFLLLQEKHHQRLARLQRMEDVLTKKGDSANLVRVRALQAKELAAFESLSTEMRKSLSESQAQAVESTGEVGTRRVSLQGSAASKQKAKPQASIGQKNN